jgi:hypothetical protein
MKFEFTMVGNLCIYNGDTLAAVMAEGRAPEDAGEDERTYTLALLRTWDGKKVIHLAKVTPVTATGREIEMLHECLANAAGALDEVVEDEHDTDEIEEIAGTLEVLARLLGG